MQENILFDADQMVESGVGIIAPAHGNPMGSDPLMNPMGSDPLMNP